MKLDELIENLQQKRTELGGDVFVRIGLPDDEKKLLFIDSINWTVNKHDKKIVIIEADDIP